jgi:hypothetical protein
VVEFKYLETATHQICVHEEINSRLNLGNVCFHSVGRHLSSRLLPKNCETCSLRLREEHRSRVFETRVLRKIFGPKREELAGGGAGNDDMCGACITHETFEKCIKILAGKPEVRRQLGSPRCRWEDNIRMDLREMGWEDMD